MTQLDWIKIALTPFSRAYGFITDIRNLCFDLQLFPEKKPQQFTISIGNLTVGGTGKTPVTEYLADFFSRKVPTAILSRGYGRKTKGFLLATPASTPNDIGDEPAQYFQKFHPEITVAVSESRVLGAAKIALERPETKLLLLDDAYQHRHIARNINILLNDFGRPFYEDQPFPAGRLRERRKGANRADAVIVTKAPSLLDPETRESVTKQLR